MAKDIVKVPVDVERLLPVPDRKLPALIKSLTPGDWHKPTIAKLWTVKDVAAHLLEVISEYFPCIRPGQLKDKVRIEGDNRLGEIALSMVSVMA
ncbi:MAG: DinB family protein [Ferruginibacter sp.]